MSFEIERTGVQAARALNKHATQHLDRVGGGGRKLATSRHGTGGPRRKPNLGEDAREESTFTCSSLSRKAQWVCGPWKTSCHSIQAAHEDASEVVRVNDPRAERESDHANGSGSPKETSRDRKSVV